MKSLQNLTAKKAKQEILEELLNSKKSSILPFEEKKHDSLPAAGRRQNFDFDEMELDLAQLDKVVQIKKKALTYYAAGEYEFALKKFEEATKILPGDLELMFFQAQCFFQMGNLEKTEALLSELYELDENNGISQLPKMLILTLLKRQKFKEAEELIRQQLPVAAKVHDLQLMNMLGYALEKQNQLPEAERVFLQVIKQDSENANACNSLAFIYAQQGIHLNEAVQLINRALKKEPKNPAYIDTLGMIYLKKGNATAATSTFRRALQVAPQSGEILAHLNSVLGI